MRGPALERPAFLDRIVMHIVGRCDTALSVAEYAFGNMGLDAEPLLSAAERRETAERYVDNELRAIASDVFGSPAYVLDGEVFWGQDRLDLLDDALATGRPPFRPNA